MEKEKEEEKKKVKKERIYENGALTVFKYCYVVEDGPDQGKKFDLVEIQKIKRVWDKERHVNYEKVSFVTLTEEKFADMIKFFKIK